jgi:hypothetical protein
MAIQISSAGPETRLSIHAESIPPVLSCLGQSTAYTRRATAARCHKSIRTESSVLGSSPCHSAGVSSHLNLYAGHSSKQSTGTDNAKSFGIPAHVLEDFASAVAPGTEAGFLPASGFRPSSNLQTSVSAAQRWMRDAINNKPRAAESMIAHQKYRPETSICQEFRTDKTKTAECCLTWPYPQHVEQKCLEYC